MTNFNGVLFLMMAYLRKYFVVLCLTCCVSNDRRLCYNVLCVSCYRRLCYIAWRRILADILLCYRPSGDKPTRLRFCTNTETAMQCYRPSGASRLVTSYPRSSICVPAPISASTISNISVFSTISNISFFLIIHGNGVYGFNKNKDVSTCAGYLSS